MGTDLFLVIGIVIAALTIPAIVSAWSDRRPPRVATLVLMIGGALIIAALVQKPGGYRVDDVPHAFVRVIGHFLR
ncbi:MAG: hypothetical protein WDA25_00500 [Paracoccaceae bacterium]